MKRKMLLATLVSLTQALNGAASSNSLSLAEQERLNGELAFMIMGGDLEAVTDVLQRGADPAMPETRNGKIIGKMPLTYAVLQAEHGIAALLLTKGAKAKINEPDIKITRGVRLPLQLAVDREDLNMVKLFVENGADIQARELGTAGVLETPDALDLVRSKLRLNKNSAVYTQMLAYFVTELRKIEPGIDPVHARELNEQLVDAIVTDDTPRFKALIEQGANPIARTFGQESPLESAVQYKRHEIAEDLLKLGAPVNELGAARGTKQTLLHLAVDNGDLPMIQVLVKYDANPQLVDQYGRTPLEFTLQKKHHAWHHQKETFETIAEYLRAINAKQSQ